MLRCENCGRDAKFISVSTRHDRFHYLCCDECRQKNLTLAPYRKHFRIGEEVK